MVVKQEIGKGINGKRGFPYGDGIIMKVGCEIPTCNVEESSEILGQVEEETENEESLDEIEKNQDLKMFFEHSINYSINPRAILQECNSIKDPYDEDMAEVKYLFSKPVAFIIIGKPSPDNMKLGQKLAAFWGCLYIDPITCFNMEPEEAESPILLWCHKHLSEGRKIPSEIVMRVMEQRALSDEAMHRGFVICGLPFAQQNGEPSAQEQMHMIFSWPVEPKIFIYVTCPNADVVTKNKQMYYDSVTGNYINKNVFSIHKEVLLVFSHEPRISTIGSVTDDVYKEIEQEKKLVAEKDVNHLVVMPDPNLEYILPRFQQAALPPVELYIAQVHPQFVIRVDGRTTPAHMLRIVKARLEALPLQPVCQPASIFKQRKQHSKDQTGDETAETDIELEEQEEEEVGMEGEEDEFPLEFANLDEAYQELCVRDTVGNRFKWKKSNWGFWCPVSLHSGKVVQGDAKYSARFLNKLYFLSSLEALNAFLKNPRKFLLPPNPRPACKFIIVGHAYSGKSTTASYLAHAYQGKVIHFPTYTEDIKMKRKQMKEKSTREAATETKVKETNNERVQQYEEAEKKRQNDLELWKQAHLDAIQQTIPEYDENVEVMDPMFPELYEELEELRATINFEAPLIPQLSYARCRWLNKHPEELIRYAPPYLFFPTPKPKLIDERDPTIIEYVETAVKSAMDEEDPEPAIKQDGEILVEGIKEAEKEFTAKTEGQKLDGGWVIDDMSLNPQIWEYLTNEGITPEIVISLQDCSSEYIFLKTKKLAQLQEIAEAKRKQEAEGEEEVGEHEQEEIYTFGYEQKLLPEVGPDSEELIEYAEQLKQFDEKWNSLKESITPIHTPINVDVADKPLSNLLLEVGHKIQALYNVSAEPFTEEDRAEERNQNQNLDEMEPEEDEQIDEETEDILKNRRMGETMTYCPVAYGMSHVLWKGKDDLLAKYKGKVYTFSDEEAMEKFMNEPWSYVKRHKPETFLPPLRICIVGPAGSGKTSLGKLLARSLGLFHKDLALEINRTVIPKCKPVGRKVQYLEGRYIKNESNVRPSEETFQGEQPQIEGYDGEELQMNESENEINVDVENRKLRESIEQYLTDGTPMPETLLSKILVPLWKEQPFLCNGFVLSGFPWHPEDVDIMKKNYLIPDVIIYLSIPNEDIVKSRLLKEMKEFHEKELAKQKRKAEKERARLAALAAEGVHDSSSLHLELQDFLLTHLQQALSYEQVGEHDEINRGLTPGEDEFEGEGEEEEDQQEILRMQYEDDIQEWFMSDMEKLETIKTLAEEHGINWLEMNAVNEMQDVCLRIVHEIYPLKLRSSTSFEQTFPITFEEAEKLLKTGYYFLSQFGRWCPVQLAARKTPIQLFEPMNQKSQVFPVIHRQFIYFLGGQENLTMFQKDPLKYILNAQALPSIPVKIAIIGPPKSGKSSLAKRLSKELNIKVITVGQAIRYVLEDLSWTELALAVDDILREGEVVPAKMAMRCVEAATMDPRSATQGYVFDGFPATTEQIDEMALLNLLPYLIINLDCTLLTCVSRLQSQDESFFSRTPIFSSQLLQHKYSCWYPIFSQVKSQLNAEYHNVETLDANNVIWWLYERATDHLYKIMKSIYDYYADVTIGNPGKLEYMCITPNEFKDRQSKYLHFCPGCLQNGQLISGGTPPDKKGLVQYKVHYYWICESHYDEFLKKPSDFIPPTNLSELPDHLPRIPTEDDEDLELANDGYCIVTYADSIPERILVKGFPEYSVIYGNKKYMFASAEQRDKFLSDPSYYGDKKICMLPLRMPSMNVLRFPTLGFLEQTVSIHLHSALLGVGTERPKYPGLPLDLSGAIYLGYYLKLINSATSVAQTEMLTKAQEEFQHRCNILKKFCHKTKIRNPLLLHPEDEGEQTPKAVSEEDL